MPEQTDANDAIAEDGARKRKARSWCTEPLTTGSWFLCGFARCALPQPFLHVPSPYLAQVIAVIRLALIVVLAAVAGGLGFAAWDSFRQKEEETVRCSRENSAAFSAGDESGTLAGRHPESGCFRVAPPRARPATWARWQENSQSMPHVSSCIGGSCGWRCGDVTKIQFPDNHPLS